MPAVKSRSKADRDQRFNFIVTMADSLGAELILENFLVFLNLADVTLVEINLDVAG